MSSKKDTSVVELDMAHIIGDAEPEVGPTGYHGGGLGQGNDKLSTIINANKARFNRGHDGGGMHDTPTRIVSRKLPDGSIEQILISPATLKQSKANQKAQAVAAKAQAQAQAVAEAAANESARQKARQLAQEQAEAVARQLAKQQAKAAARQLAHQQAEAAARQIAHQQAEAAAHRLAQQQAEAAAQHLIQQQAENARLAAEADTKAHAQVTIQAITAAPSLTPATRAAALAFEMAIKTATSQFLSSAARALGPATLAFYPSELGDGELRPANTSNPTAPPGIDALGPTTFPVASPFPSSYPGGQAVSNPTQNETLPGLDPADANASIPGRPADDELPSPDVMENRRNDPGIADGYGKPISGTWLGDPTRKDGAPIPSQIADQLRGQTFRKFDDMREAIWRAVARDAELSKQFSKANLEQMKQGNAPYALPADQSGKRNKFEIHHKQWISDGGAVYDMGNLAILPPQQHIQTHKPEKQP